MMSEDRTEKLSREQLYNEIWEISVAGTAKKYNASYVELLKLCKDNDIPIPPSGYWTKLSFGKPVIKTPLPESSILEVTLPTNSSSKRSKLKETSTSITETQKPVQPIVAENHTAIEMPNKNQDIQLTYRTVSGERNTYNREKLYEEVWAKPVVKVAVQYGVSDVAIHKICKSLNVPVPPRGYWSKIRAGGKIKKTPLPETKGAIGIIGARTFEGVKVSNTSSQPLSFLPEIERQKVLFTAQEIKLLAENAQVHRKIAAYKSVVKEWNKKDTKLEGAQRSFKTYSNRPPFLAGVISTETLPRVNRLLDALFRQVERLGGSINDDLSLQIRNEHVRLEISEAQDEVKHVMTKKEAQEMIIYEDAKRHNTWASQPGIRKYDYVFNGRLRVTIRQGRYFRDTDDTNIESRLGDMLIELYKKSEVVRIDREAREEAARKREEEARLKEERRNRYNEEVERTIALKNEALDYEKACRIRTYINAVESTCSQSGFNDETAAWIEWAKKKADWYDPIVARDDELFGQREHEKSEDQKTIKKAGYSWW